MVMMICPKANECEDTDCLHYSEHRNRCACESALSIGYGPRNPTGCPKCIPMDFFSEDEFKL